MTASTQSAQAPAFQDVMGVTNRIEESVTAGDLANAKKMAMALMQSGKTMRTRAILMQSNPLPIAEKLVGVLASSVLKMEPELKFTIAKTARLFIELTCLKASAEKWVGASRVKSELITKIQEMVTPLKKKENEEIALRHELDCAKAKLKLMKSDESIWGGYVVTLLKVILDGDFGSGIEQVQQLSSKLNKSSLWIGQVHCIYFTGMECMESLQMLKQIQSYMRSHLQEKQVTLCAVNVFADLVENGTPEVQREAFLGQPGLLSLSRIYATNPLNTLWAVRYLALQHLIVFTSHPDPLIRKEALQRLCVPIGKENPHVKALLFNYRSKPELKEQLKRFFQANAQEIQEQIAKERNELQRQGEAVQQQEEKIDHILNTVEGLRDQYARGQVSQDELANKEQELRSERDRLGGQREVLNQLQQEYEAKRDDYNRLYQYLEKDVNEVFSQILDSQNIVEVPDEYLCPITLEVMADPVMAADGNTYERESIEKWIRENGTSPITRLKLAHKAVTPNINLKKGIEAWRRGRVVREVNLQQLVDSPTLPKSTTEPTTRNGDLADLLTQLLENPAIEKQPELFAFLENKYDLVMDLNRANALDKTNILLYNQLTQLVKIDNQINRFAARRLLEQRTSAPQASSDSDPNNNNPTASPETPPVVTPAEQLPLQQLMSKATEGDAEAQFNVGKRYALGTDIAQDHTQAARWYRKAAKQGHARAQIALGACYQNGEGVVKHAAQTVSWYRKAAENGSAVAQIALGVCYQNGEGVIKDAGQAADWYRKAAEQGHAIAQNDLGYCYQYGQGVTKDDGQAAHWYRKAAEQGSAVAQFNLGVCYKNGHGVTKDAVQAAHWYRKAADQGHADAQNDLGYCYENGEGVTMNYTQAVSWFEKAAKQGHVNAQFHLSWYYENGYGGVVKGFSQAAHCYKKAAEQGHAIAQYMLGICYENGRGIAQDAGQAISWYRKAADQGHAIAQYTLGARYEHGAGGVTKDAGQAVSWYRKAADQGHAHSQLSLGACYKYGRGVAQDKDQADFWLKKAAEQGDCKAKAMLDNR